MNMKHGGREISDRVKILHDCFPDLMPDILNRMQAHCKYVLDNQLDYRKYWLVQPLLGFDWWLSCVQDLFDLLSNYREKLLKKRIFFALEMFESSCKWVAFDFLFRLCPDILNNKSFTDKMHELFSEFYV